MGAELGGCGLIDEEVVEELGAWVRAWRDSPILVKAEAAALSVCERLARNQASLV